MSTTLGDARTREWSWLQRIGACCFWGTEERASKEPRETTRLGTRDKTLENMAGGWRWIRGKGKMGNDKKRWGSRNRERECWGRVYERKVSEKTAVLCLGRKKTIKIGKSWGFGVPFICWLNCPFIIFLFFFNFLKKKIFQCIF